ncbi:pyridoxamine 5'-phosphate oxidase family protein [Candidatus Bipolaricaulota bacterium]|nr:pyridoxamine 5'-phosphate oxidase family protein [Candidatus Bipolaricaulota bacterium]
MNEAEVRTACLELMSKTVVVYLTALEEDGYPRIRAMLNLRNKTRYPDQAYLYETHDDDFMIYISTNTSSRKVKDIQANPRIGLYFCTTEDRFFGVSLTGNAEIITDMNIKQAVWAEGWEQYYPTTGDANDPDYTLLRVFPTNARGWMRAQTFEFAISR